MATDRTLELEQGDLVRITKLTRLYKLGPEGKGFSYDYVAACLDENDVRSNADILAIAKDLVAVRKRTMALLVEVRNKKHRTRK